MVRTSDSREKLAIHLLQATPREQRCPYLREDHVGPYCSNSLSGEAAPSESRRMVCDTYSLQLWCLDIQRCDKCIFHKDPDFSGD